jgi:ubiquinol-cytochrome c reductase cytochrome b subunit
VAVYPFVEEWVTGDHRDHHLLDRPRNEATRTGVGVGALVFYGVLWGTASADLVATHFHLAVESVVVTAQVLVVAGPPVAFWITRRVCLALQKRDRDILLHGYETGRIVRLPGGEYVELHERVDADERVHLAGPAPARPATLRPDDRGRLRLSERLRAGLSRAFFEDRLEPAAAEPVAAEPVATEPVAAANVAAANIAAANVAAEPVAAETEHDDEVGGGRTDEAIARERAGAA